MDPVRDLGRIDPWQESLERSLARRSKSKRGSTKSDQRRGERRATPTTSTRRPTTDRPRARQRGARRFRAGVVGIPAVVVPVLVLLSLVVGQGTHPSPIPAQAHTKSAAVGGLNVDSTGAGPLFRWPLSRVIEAGLTRACRPSSSPGDYVNPLGGARVRPERIDQGVDYAGSGGLAAIGPATVTYVATTGTGWPGSFIEYRLLGGPDVGCYVYYAEGVNPVAGLRTGDTVAAGQLIARIVSGWSTGIELGWGAGTSTATYAEATHQWSATSDEDSVPTAAGKTFSALIAALGGPPGKVEG